MTCPCRGHTSFDEIMKDVSRQSGVYCAFVMLFLLTALPSISSPLALLLGFGFVLLFGNPNPGLSSRVSKVWLQLSVIGLGFGVNIIEVVALGKESLLLTLLFILATVGLGTVVGQALQLSANIRVLIAFGTAICGGSAIAALAPVLKARDEEVAVSLATVFSLNAVALLLFPAVGKLLQLSQEQFGLWCALAIHDTSSVVGAASTYGAVALTVGTTAKLTRALWIAPCVLMAGMWRGTGRKLNLPYFIFGFIAAACLNSWLADFRVVWDFLYLVARQALVMTLFLIGAGLTKDVLQRIGVRPLVLGVFLWLAVSVCALLVVMTGLAGA